MDLTPVEILYLRAARARINMGDVCAHAGVSLSTPSRWKSGIRNAQPDVLHKLEMALDHLTAERAA